MSGICMADCAAGGDALCGTIDAGAMTCSAAAGDVCVRSCASPDSACPEGYSCLEAEGACLPTGSFAGGPCRQRVTSVDPPCDAFIATVPEAPVEMACLEGICAVPCRADEDGDALCQRAGADLICSPSASSCVPSCAAGCPRGTSCFEAEGACLPAGAFPGSPCRPDVGGPRCDDDTGEGASVDLVCVGERCLIDCQLGGDFVCGLADEGLRCSDRAGGVCLSACEAEGECPDGQSCLLSEGTCQPTGSFPGSPCVAPAAGGEASCGVSPGGAPLVCADPDPGASPRCFIDCTGGGTEACQAVSGSLSCYIPTSGPSLCLPNGTFPESLCRRGDESPCDGDLYGRDGIDQICVGGTCQVECTRGGTTLCAMASFGTELSGRALSCVDTGVGGFCARTGCSDPGGVCPEHYFCDPSLNACLPYRPLHVVHTGDLHSHFDGLPPSSHPGAGGFPQLASLIREAQARGRARDAVTLTLDAGDWMMGTLFHLLGGRVETGFLRYLGYDAAAMGERELDWGPAAFASFLQVDLGAAPILEAAIASALGCDPGVGECPALAPVPIVNSNLVFDELSAGDDALEALYDESDALTTMEAPLNRYLVLDKGGVRVAIFGLLGEDAAAASTASLPLRFDSPAGVAEEMVRLLRAPPIEADLVIALSHSGLLPPPFRFEDEYIADEVEGLDLIISGHTHEVVAPERFGDTWVVAAGFHGANLGELELALPTLPWVAAQGALDPRIVRWSARPVDPEGPQDPVLAAARPQYLASIDAALASAGLSYDTVLGSITSDLVEHSLMDSDLGNLVTDASRARLAPRVVASADPTPVQITLDAGVDLRDDLRVIPGAASTPVTVADAFSVVPLGASPSDPSTIGFPMVTFYLTIDELKRVLEVGTTAAPMNGSDYWIYTSGMRWSWEPEGPPFNRVSGIWLDPDGGADLCDQASNLLGPGGVAKDPGALYRVGTNLYIAGFLEQLLELTGGVLSVALKDAAGAPVSSLDRIVAGSSGELRQWQVLVEHLRALAESHGGLIPKPSGPRVVTDAQRQALCE